MIFQALEPLQPPWPHRPLQPQKLYLTNPNFHWYPIPFLSEAVEASRCYFFENQVCISKIPNLRILKLLSNKILLAYFYLSEPIHKVQFNMRYPVLEVFRVSQYFYFPTSRLNSILKCLGILCTLFWFLVTQRISYEQFLLVLFANTGIPRLVRFFGPQATALFEKRH